MANHISPIHRAMRNSISRETQTCSDRKHSRSTDHCASVSRNDQLSRPRVPHAKKKKNKMRSTLSAAAPLKSGIQWSVAYCSADTTRRWRSEHPLDRDARAERRTTPRLMSTVQQNDVYTQEHRTTQVETRCESFHRGDCCSHFSYLSHSVA